MVDVDVDRATALARALTDRFPTARVDAGEIDKLPVLLPHSDGLVHCTPTGMADHPGLPVDPDLLHAGLWVADIVYRPLNTELLQAARRAGCRTLSGGHMAVHQAADTFTLVTGIRPDLDRMFATFTRPARRRSALGRRPPISTTSSIHHISQRRVDVDHSES